MSPERRLQYDTRYEPDNEVFDSRTFSYAHPKIGTEALCHDCSQPIKCIGLDTDRGGVWTHIRDEKAGAHICQSSCDLEMPYVTREVKAAFTPCPLPKGHKGKHLWRRFKDLEREG
jgi:hypothetical protein